MKILILGCNGMAGHMISLYFYECGYKVYGLARSESKQIPTFVCDASDFSRMKEIILVNRFDVIINCIAILNRHCDQNKPQAIQINSLLPHFLAEITKNQPTKVIHMSSESVFSGNAGNYTEDDLPDGRMFYGRTKALGELIDDKNLTLRNSVIGPDIKISGQGLLNWFLLNNSNDIDGYVGSIWTGQTSLQIAKTMEAAICADAVGLINAVPDNSISKYELLCLFNQYFFSGQKNIHPVAGVVENKSLIRTNTSFDYKIPGYEEMISDLYQWMKCHKTLYPYYQL